MDNENNVPQDRGADNTEESQHAAVSIQLKPNKPETFSGVRDYLVVNTWLYKVEQYFNLVQLGNKLKLTDENKITYASTLLTNTAAIWWYTMLNNPHKPNSWVQFVPAIQKEFVPEDHERRARDKLRTLKQTSSVSNYLSDFRNIVLTIPDISASEKWDKFVTGLKGKIQFEVRKANCYDFEEATKIAMRVEAAFAGSSYDENIHGNGTESSDPMEIGNVEGRSRFKSKQRLDDINNNACFVCHKPGCRPYKHRREQGAQKANVSNLKVQENTLQDDSDSSEN